MSLKSASSFVLIKSCSRSQKCAQIRCDLSVTLTHSADEVWISFLAETRGFSTVKSKNPNFTRAQTVSNPQQQRTRARDLLFAKSLIKGADERRAGGVGLGNQMGGTHTQRPLSLICVLF